MAVLVAILDSQGTMSLATFFNLTQAGDSAYPGDLLTAVLQTAQSFWAGDSESLERVRRIVRELRGSEALAPSMRQAIDSAVANE